MVKKISCTKDLELDQMQLQVKAFEGESACVSMHGLTIDVSLFSIRVYTFELSLLMNIPYRRSGIDCKILSNANCENFHILQSKESQEKEYAMNNIILDLATFAKTLNTCSYLHSTVQSHSTVDCLTVAKRH